MKLISALLILISPVLAGLFVSGCNLKSNDYGSKIIVQVNNSKYLAKDFSEQLARRLSQFDALAAKDKSNVVRIKEELIQSFIVKAITLNWAEQNKVTVSNEELDAEINKIRSNYPDDLSFRRVLAQENLSFNSWKESLAYSLLERKVLKKTAEDLPPPPEDEVRKYYDSNKDRYKKRERIHLKQIVLDQEVDAEKVRDELTSSKKKSSFEDLAKKFSVAPEAKSGGDLGWIERGTVDIFDKAFQYQVGSISPVLESPYGFHLFKVEKKLPAGTLSLDDVRAQIKKELILKREQTAFSSWLETQLRVTKVLRDNVLISAISVQTRSQ